MSRGDDRAYPQDLQAEESLLGAMLLARDARDVGVRMVRAEDFYKPAHQHVFTAILDLHRQGQAVDPITVADVLRREGLIDQVGGSGALLTLQTGTPATSNASRYATIIQEKATLRNLLHVAGQMGEAVYSGREVDEVVREAQDAVSSVVLPSGTVAAGPFIDDFLAEPDHYDWVVPGLLERGDRLILTGGEGKGKSTILRQFAIQASAGIIPFTDRAGNPPVRVTLVDCENSEAQSKRALRPLRVKAGVDLRSDFLTILVRPQGLDLLRRGDRKWLQERIEANAPDVLILGPMYRLHNDDPNDEKPARQLAAFLDDLRVRHQFALVMETHQPHASGGTRRVLRPYGASLWVRWPEFGLGLLHDEKTDGWRLVPWRGSRDDRSWPPMLTRGGPWLWNEVRPSAGLLDSFEEVL